MPRTRLAATALLAALAACSSTKGPIGPDPDPVITYALALLTAPPATAEAGSTVSVTFRVTRSVDGGAATAAPGQPVTVTATGGGTLGNNQPTREFFSDNSGNVVVAWTLGSGAGAQGLQATGPTNVSAQATVTATAPVVTQLSLAQQIPANAITGVPFFTQPVVQLTRNGTPHAEAGVPVTVSVSSGSATVAVATGGTGTLTVNTDASGRATFTDLVLNGNGSNTLAFSTPGATTITSEPTTVATQQPQQAVGFAYAPLPPATAGTVQYVRYTAASGTTELKVGVVDGTGDAQLFVRRVGWPTATQSDCSSTAPGASHQCIITGSDLSGTWYVAVRSASNTSEAFVAIRGLGPACIGGPMQLGVPVNDAAPYGGACGSRDDVHASRAYSLTIPNSMAMRIAYTSNRALAITFKRPQDLRMFQDPGSALTLTTLPILVAPGTYEIDVSDWFLGNVPTPRTSQVTVSEANPVFGDVCEAGFWASGGLTIGLNLSANNCVGTTPGTRSHRLYIPIARGQTMTVTMASTAFDPILRLRGSQTTSDVGPTLVTDDNGGGGTTARLVYTNNGPTAFFTLELSTTTPGGLGAYTFTGSFDIPVYDLRADEGGFVSVLRTIGVGPGLLDGK